MLLVIKKFKSGIMLFTVNYVIPGNILSVLERLIKACMLCCVRCSVMLCGLCAQFVRERALQCRNCKSYKLEFNLSSTADG